MEGVETASKQKVQFTVPADLKFSSLLRHISEDVFLHAGFTQEWADRLKLVVDELFMNANRYGSKVGGNLYISYSFDKDTVGFLIEDEGQGTKPMKAQELKAIISKNVAEMTDVKKTNGRGLAFFSHSWTDQLMIEDSERGGIAVSFSKKITTEMPPDFQKAQELAPAPPKDQVTLLTISGQVDASNMEEKMKPVSEAIEKIEKGSTLTLDFAEVDYINSTFIGYLVSWLNVVQNQGAYLTLKNLNSQLRGILDVVGLTKVIYIES